MPQTNKEAGKAAKEFGSDLGYVDLNFTVCVSSCFTAGFQAGLGDGLYAYYGFGFGSDQLSGALTFAPGQHISRFFFGVHGSAGVFSGQLGLGTSKEDTLPQQLFGEVG